MKKIEQYREAFDYAFLGHCKLNQQEVEKLFKEAGIQGYVKLCTERRVMGNFAHSFKSLADLTKLSFKVYSNLDQLPLKKKVIIPEKNGSYKFVVTGLSSFYGLEEDKESSDNQFSKEDIILLSNDKPRHKEIIEGIGYNSKLGKINDIDIFGGGRLDIDHDNKTILVYRDSGSFGSCSNEIIERLFEDLKEKGYDITVKLEDQKYFFDETKP